MTTSRFLIQTLLFLGLTLCLCYESKSQTPNFVIGELLVRTTSNIFYSKIDTNLCQPHQNSSVNIPLDRFFLLDVAKCTERMRKYYLVYHENGSYWVEKYYFWRTDGLDEKVIALKEKYPSLQVRIQFARLEQDKIIRLSEIKDSIAIIDQTRFDDSTAKVFEKSMAVAREKNLILYEWNWNYESEYSISIDIDFTVLNPYKKKIKYLWFTVKAWNPVDDPISGGVKTSQGIGPIEYGTTGSYHFENVIYSRVISKVRLTQIKIQFFDGSIKIISNPIQIKQKED